MTSEGGSAQIVAAATADPNSIEVIPHFFGYVFWVYVKYCKAQFFFFNLFIMFWLFCQ